MHRFIFLRKKKKKKKKKKEKKKKKKKKKEKKKYLTVRSAARSIAQKSACISNAAAKSTQTQQLDKTALGPTSVHIRTSLLLRRVMMEMGIVCTEHSEIFQMAPAMGCF